MVTQAKSWLKENSTLASFLGAQLVAMLIGLGSMVAYYVKMETRVAILETRGAAFTIDKVDNIERRLTVMEQVASKNSASIERIVDVLTGGLHLPPQEKK